MVIAAFPNRSSRYRTLVKANLLTKTTKKKQFKYFYSISLIGKEPMNLKFRLGVITKKGCISLSWGRSYLWLGLLRKAIGIFILNYHWNIEWSSKSLLEIDLAFVLSLKVLITSLKDFMLRISLLQLKPEELNKLPNNSLSLRFLHL